MYTSGHEDILTDAISRMRPEDRWSFEGEIEELTNAVSYPDLPCGSIDLDADGNLEDNLRMCEDLDSVGVGANLLLGNKDSMEYQSHMGFYSLWHSMTIDPNMTVTKVVKNVVEYIIICCKLAFERKSMFWLGFALHIVMDSYSPAHVLREGSYPDVRTSDLVAWVKSYDSETTIDARRNISNMRSIINTVVEGVAAKKSMKEILGSVKASQRTATMFVLFDHIQRIETFGKIVKRTPPPKVARSSSSSSNSRSIMNFYYYPMQTGLFHNTNDLILQVKNTGNYEPCVSDVCKLLTLYNTHVEKNKKTPSMTQFLREVWRLLVTKTYRIHPECGEAETGFDIVSVIYPNVDSLEFFIRGDDPTFVFLRNVRNRATTTKIELIDPSEGVFGIPINRLKDSKNVVVQKKFRFSKVRASKKSDADASHMTYTFLKQGDSGLGFPVSMEWNGRVYESPSFIGDSAI